MVQNLFLKLFMVTNESLLLMVKWLITVYIVFLKMDRSRGNLAVGGRGEVHPLNEDDYRIANTVAKWTKKHSVVVAGIDVIGKCLTEVNLTSPTAMQQIYQQAGVNVAERILKVFKS